jgi:hypothetical protein
MIELSWSFVIGQLSDMYIQVLKVQYVALPTSGYGQAGKWNPKTGIARVPRFLESWNRWSQIG